MSVESNKRLVECLVEDSWNAGDGSRLADFCSAGVLDEVAGIHGLLLTAFPDLTVTVEDMVAEGDKVVARLTFRGTHEGVFREIPPTHRPVEFTAIRIYRVSGGKVAETWANQDVFGLLEQIGAL